MQEKPGYSRCIRGLRKCDGEGFLTPCIVGAIHAFDSIYARSFHAKNGHGEVSSIRVTHEAYLYENNELPSDTSKDRCCFFSPV